MSNSSNRISYWDNLKAILIFLVVLGHILLPVSPKGQAVFAVYTWIYLFHMPAFVFVSGYFSKRFVEKGAKDIRKLIGFLVLYVVFDVAIWIIKMIFTRDVSMIFIFSPSGASWYLICMFLWYCMIPYCAKVRPVPMIILSLIAALLVGFEWQAGNFLALQRCFVFFPFFLIGYHFDYAWIEKARPSLKIVSAVILVLVFILIWFFPDLYVKYTSSMSVSNPYTHLISGFIERSVWYIVASVMVAAMLLVTPRKKYFFTYIGQRTLAIYIIHRLIRDVCQYIGIYEKASSDLMTLIVEVAASIVITFALSSKFFTDLFGKVFTTKYRLLLEDKNAK